MSPSPTAVVEPTQCRIPRRGLVSPLKRLIRSTSLHKYDPQRREHEGGIGRQSDCLVRRGERTIKVFLLNKHKTHKPVGKPQHLRREMLIGKNLSSQFPCFSNIGGWIITDEDHHTHHMVQAEFHFEERRTRKL